MCTRGHLVSDTVAQGPGPCAVRAINWFKLSDPWVGIVTPRAEHVQDSPLGQKFDVGPEALYRGGRHIPAPWETCLPRFNVVDLGNVPARDRMVLSGRAASSDGPAVCCMIINTQCGQDLSVNISCLQCPGDSGLLQIPNLLHLMLRSDSFCKNTYSAEAVQSFRSQVRSTALVSPQSCVCLLYLPGRSRSVVDTLVNTHGPWWTNST